MVHEVLTYKVHHRRKGHIENEQAQNSPEQNHQWMHLTARAQEEQVCNVALYQIEAWVCPGPRGETA